MTASESLVLGDITSYIRTCGRRVLLLHHCLIHKRARESHSSCRIQRPFITRIKCRRIIGILNPALKFRGWIKHDLCIQYIDLSLLSGDHSLQQIPRTAQPAKFENLWIPLLGGQADKGYPNTMAATSCSIMCRMPRTAWKK